VINAVGAMRPISFATARWKQEFRKILLGSTSPSLNSPRSRCVLKRFTEIACEFVAS
jgi:hypothetical protein